MAFVFRAEKIQPIKERQYQSIPIQYESTQNKEIAENNVPFNTTKEREGIISKTAENLGPGSYEVTKDLLAPIPTQHVFFIPANQNEDNKETNGNSVFKSKSTRFGNKKTEEIPGPGSYNTNHRFIKKNNNNLKSNYVPNNLNLVKDIIRKENKIAPSIPSNIHSYGYTESEDHNLVLNKNPLLQVQQFVGPGYYESKFNNQGAKYQGPAWHKTSDKQKKAFETPSTTSNLVGPGTYTFEEQSSLGYKSNPHANFISTTTRSSDNAVKKKLGLGKFQSRTPMSAQSLVKRDISGMETDIDDEEDDEYIKEATPGPGHYHNESLLSSFGSKTPSSNLSLSAADKLRHFPRSLKAQAFGSSPRFKDYNINNNEVGPGEYEVQTKPKNFGLKYIKVPFQSSDTRFQRGNASSNPGPGNYDPTINMMDKIKTKAKTGYAGSFGITENRFKISKLLEQTPGPGSYIRTTKDKDNKNKEKNSHYFVSQIERGVFSEKQEHQAFPGTYELDYYNISKKVQKDEDSLDPPKNVGIVGFNTGQPRFSMPKEKPIPEDDDEDEDDEPRFGTSKNLESLLKSKMKQKPNSVFLSKTGRNIGGIRNDGLPGPGAYFEQNQNGWNKRTFNIHFTGE